VAERRSLAPSSSASKLDAAAAQKYRDNYADIFRPKVPQKGVVPGIPLGRKKPPQSPDMQKWVDNDGIIEFLPEGVKYTNKNGVSVLYRHDTYPDFKRAGSVVEEVRINMIGDHVKDYDAARAALRQKGVSEQRIAELFDPTKYTPHHFEDQKTMQFVEQVVHSEFKHQGSVSDIKNGRPPVTYP